MKHLTRILVAVTLCMGASAIAQGQSTANDPYQEGKKDYYSGLCPAARPYLNEDEEKDRSWYRGFRDAQRVDHDRVDRSYCHGAAP